MMVPQIKNGKRPEEHMNIKHMLALPAKTPFGNMCLKHSKIVSRLDHVNLKLSYVYKNWRKPGAEEFDPSYDPTEHLLWAEEIIYFLRVTIDELISLAYLMYACKRDGDYPSAIIISNIGRLIGNQSLDCQPFCDIFSNHKDWLETFDKVTNAYKHSFINSDQTIIGRDEPCVPALNIYRNDLKNGETFYNLSLATVVDQFNGFYEQATTYIKENARSHL